MIKHYRVPRKVRTLVRDKGFTLTIDHSQFSLTVHDCDHRLVTYVAIDEACWEEWMKQLVSIRVDRHKAYVTEID